VRLLEVPDPRWSSPSTNARIMAAFNDLAHRPIGRLVEQDLMECHSPEKAEAIASGPLKLSGELCQDDRRALDDAVFELLGVTDPGRRRALVTRLHEEAARHFRKIRIVEIQKQQQRAGTGGRRFTADDLAEDAWDAAELSDSRPLPDWLADEAEPKSKFIIPKSGAPSLMPPSDMYDRAAVYFGRGQRAARVSCQSRAQAELLSKLAALGVRGMQRLPAGEAGLSRRLSSPRCPFRESAERV